MKQNRFWYFPYNPNGYDVLRAFKEQGFIYWQQNKRKYEVGDVMYIYASRPIQRIVAKAEIVEANIVYDPSMDNDAAFAITPDTINNAGDICVKVVPLSYNVGAHPNYQDLKELGGINFQGTCTLSSDRVSAIENMFEPDLIEKIDVSVGDRVENKKYGIGVISEIQNTFILVQFGDQTAKFLYPSAFRKGFLKKVK